MKKSILLLSLLLSSTMVFSESSNPVKVVAPVNENEKTIIVSQANYGILSSANVCSALGAISAYCNNMIECQIKVDNSLCGDPAKGFRKVMAINYACGKQEKSDKTNEGSIVTLTCK